MNAFLYRSEILKAHDKHVGKLVAHAFDFRLTLRVVHAVCDVSAFLRILKSDKAVVKIVDLRGLTADTARDLVE